LLPRGGVIKMRSFEGNGCPRHVLENPAHPHARLLARRHISTADRGSSSFLSSSLRCFFFFFLLRNGRLCVIAGLARAGRFVRGIPIFVELTQPAAWTMDLEHKKNIPANQDGMMFVARDTC
jgi:hypothetical protein